MPSAALSSEEEKGERGGTFMSHYREFYVAHNLVSGLRVVFSKLRGTAHALHEETGN